MSPRKKEGYLWHNVFLSVFNLHHVWVAYCMCYFLSNYWDFALCFQILSNFSSQNCKRCGLYEENSITSDEAFDEWEFCPSDFTAPHGEYVRFKEKEFNATFLCPDCLSFGGEYLATFALKILYLLLHDAIVTQLMPLQNLFTYSKVCNFSFWWMILSISNSSEFMSTHKQETSIHFWVKVHHHE